jgi:hypothetical protein
MQNPDRFVRGWRVVFGKLVAARHLSHWLFPVLILALVLGIGNTTPSSVIQAQSGGTRVSDVYYLDYRITPRTRLCFGQTLWVEAEIKMRPEWVIDANENGLPLSPRLQNITAPSINVQVLAPGGSPSVAGTFRSTFSYQAISPGTTSVEINATAQNPGYPPIPPTFSFHRSVRIDVVPCEYQVNISSIWETSMHGASTILIANAHNLRMTGPDGQNFTFEPPLEGAPFLEWTWAMNRIRGCYAGSGNFDDRAPRITATIEDNNLVMTMNFSQVAPPLAGYYNLLCRPYHSGEPCSDHPDGYCFILPEDRPLDWFEPQTLGEPERLLFPLNGGTLSTTHRINHSWGSAGGPILITVRPIRIQQ